MNPLQGALIEKAGNDHGFEYVLPGDDDAVNLASARHRAQVRITTSNGQFVLSFTSPAVAPLNAELARSFPAFMRAGQDFLASNQDALARLLRRAAELAHALPNQAAQDFETALKQELEQLPAELKNTEVERLVRQRVGQQAFRSAMLDYWGGACAVTGIAVPAVLRASHAKPWAECASDAQRLDVYNGFLLSANLDALFDRFLISFDEQGVLVIAPALSGLELRPLGIVPGMKLRWVDALHQPYLALHRARLQQSSPGAG
jgi:hypothetical protein